MQEQTSRLMFSSVLPQLAYDPVMGKFYRVRKDNQVASPVYPDEQGKLTIGASSNQIRLAMKATKAAWIVFNNKPVPEGVIIYPKNFDDEDCRAFNLGSLPKEEFDRLKEAYNNINRDLKIKPHKTDQYSYIVQYRENGLLKKTIFEDIVNAKRFHRRLLVAYTKIVGKYLTTD